MPKMSDQAHPQTREGDAPAEPLSLPSPENTTGSTT